MPYSLSVLGCLGLFQRQVSPVNSVSLVSFFEVNDFYVWEHLADVTRYLSKSFLSSGTLLKGLG
jgi:hypothetical protein